MDSDIMRTTLYTSTENCETSSHVLQPFALPKLSPLTCRAAHSQEKDKVANYFFFLLSLLICAPNFFLSVHFGPIYHWALPETRVFC
ncbi:hypothetical protein TMatcc_006104 [Talaromyces marneffei ATCC 18224]